MKKISLNRQIALALVGGGLFSSFYVWYGIESDTFLYFLKIIGESFVRLLQLTAIPIVIFSLIIGVAGAGDTKQLSRMGLLTFLLYVVTTLFSVVLGVIIGNVMVPGKAFKWLVKKFVHKGAETIDKGAEKGFSIPNNVIQLFGNNDNLLWIVGFSILVGVALLKSSKEHRVFMITFCDVSHEVLIHMMRWIMKFAPIGMFSMVSSQIIVMIKGNEHNVESLYLVMLGLLFYVGTVLLGLGCLLFIFYPLMVCTFSPVKYRTFIKTMYPAQMIALATASSTATLPKTHEQVGKLNVPNQVRSFVLSLGATVNMDGTALYQGIAALFVAQVFGQHDLTLWQQLYIVGYVTISTVGVAGIPCASLVTTSILFSTMQTMGILSLSEVAMGMALIMIPDRVLDSCRTAVNITGDGAACLIINAQQPRN